MRLGAILPTRVRGAVLEFLIDRLVGMAAKGAKKDPDKVLRRLLTLSSWICRDKLWREAIEGVRARLDAGHPAIGVARKFLTQLNPKARSILVRNLFVRETFLGPDKRHAIEDELGYYPPSTLVISPSMYCPLRCYGCYAAEYNKEEQLSFEDVDSIIKQAKDIGMHFIVFSGGEPFAWKPLLDIFKAHPDVIFQVYTSGLFFDDAMVDRVTELGNVFPSISCEGFEEETDRRRGKGAFKKVVRAMERLRDHGVFFTFSATVTRENLEVVTGEEFIDFWIARGCLVGWYFMYMPIGREPHLDLMLTPEQRVEMSRRIKRYRATKEIFLIDFWNDGEHAGGCIAGGRKYLHINNRGDVEPCVFCHFATDNIHDTTLAEAIGSHFFRSIREKQPYQPDLRRPCIMVDNPHVLREVVERTGARPTHPGAETMVTEFVEPLSKYSQAFGEALKDGPVSTIQSHV